MLLVQGPLGTIGQQYARLSVAFSSLRRIQDFLQAPTLELTASHPVDKSSGSFAAVFENATISWKEEEPVLKNINFKLQAGKLTLVTGNLASGKSTLLNSLLGETLIVNGRCDLNMTKSPIAYVAQDVWLQDGSSIKENILFFSEYDQTWYERVLSAVSLSQDMTELEAGDQTVSSPSHHCDVLLAFPDFHSESLKLLS